MVSTPTLSFHILTTNWSSHLSWLFQLQLILIFWRRWFSWSIGARGSSLVECRMGGRQWVTWSMLVVGLEFYLLCVCCCCCLSILVLPLANVRRQLSHKCLQLRRSGAWMCCVFANLIREQICCLSLCEPLNLLRCKKCTKKVVPHGVAFYCKTCNEIVTFLMLWNFILAIKIRMRCKLKLELRVSNHTGVVFIVFDHQFSKFLYCFITELHNFIYIIYWE